MEVDDKSALMFIVAIAAAGVLAFWVARTSEHPGRVYFCAVMFALAGIGWLINGGDVR
jgi:hypothetical protein